MEREYSEMFAYEKSHGPEISIIMGAYNSESTLQEALDSIFAQTMQDFELIICDDGSTDATASIIEKNMKTHNNIVGLSNAHNQGLSITLNKCLRYANGKYIARMDADDRSLPQRLNLQYEFLERNQDIDIVSGQMVCFDEHGAFRKTREEGLVLDKDFIPGSPFNHAPAMFRKQAIDHVGGYSENPYHQRVEDYELWFRMYSAGFKGYNLPEVIYEMRDDRNATKRRNFQNRLNEARVRYQGYKMLGLNPIYYIWCLRPLIIALLPGRLYQCLHRSRIFNLGQNNGSITLN